MVAKPKLLKTVVTKPAVGNTATPLTEGKPRQSVAAPAVPKATGAKIPATPVTPANKTRPPAHPNVSALKKKDLIDSVVLITGGKKKAVRDVVEATLKVLGDALSKGTMLNLPPFGKAKVSRQQDGTSGKPMTVKLRRSTAARKPKQDLADGEN